MVFLRGAIVDAGIIFWTVFMPIADAVESNGHEYGFFAAGMSVFCSSVFLANFWLYMRFHQHDKVSTLFLILMLLSGHVMYWLIGLAFKNF